FSHGTQQAAQEEVAAGGEESGVLFRADGTVDQLPQEVFYEPKTLQIGGLIFRSAFTCDNPPRELLRHSSLLRESSQDRTQFVQMQLPHVASRSIHGSTLDAKGR
ncbi:MAG: hypothetical protein MK538_02405, partial [Planctomycetes bacterium]|nr:hypothetical protein [Planctomycetota bacterium]